MFISVHCFWIFDLEILLISFNVLNKKIIISMSLHFFKWKYPLPPNLKKYIYLKEVKWNEFYEHFFWRKFVIHLHIFATKCKFSECKIRIESHFSSINILKDFFSNLYKSRSCQSFRLFLPFVTTYLLYTMWLGSYWH